MTTTSRPQPLISAEQIQSRISELALEIEADYSDSPNGITCLGILKGSVFFLVDLLQQIDVPTRVDFFDISSYEGTSSGDVRVHKDVDIPLQGQDVLIVEDIIDTGKTMKVILDMLDYRGVSSVKLCTLLDKPSRRRVEVPIDYCGFQIEDRFVVGYGLDYNENYRNLPYVGVLDGGAADDSQSEAS